MIKKLTCIAAMMIVLSACSGTDVDNHDVEILPAEPSISSQSQPQSEANSHEPAASKIDEEPPEDSVPADEAPSEPADEQPASSSQSQETLLSPVCIMDTSNVPSHGLVGSNVQGTYAGGYLCLPVSRYNNAGEEIPIKETNGRIIRADERGYILAGNGKAELIDHESDAVLKKIEFPTDIIYYTPRSTIKEIKDVASDLSAILYAYQGGDIRAGEEYVENGVYMVRTGSDMHENIMPGGYYYSTVKFINNNKMVAGIRGGSAANSEETVIYDPANHSINVIISDKSDETGLSNFISISNYYIIYRDKFYDIRNNVIVSVNIGSRYTVSDSGYVFYLSDDGKLIKLDPSTGAEQFTGYVLKNARRRIYWYESVLPDKLVASVSFDDATPNGAYLFNVE